MQTGTLSPASNCATWSESYELSDAETGDLIDLSEVDEITLVVRDQDSKSAVLTLTLTGGDITIVDTGVFQWRAEDTSMESLCAKSYFVGATIEQDDDTVQLFIGFLPVIDGIVNG